MSAWTPSRSHCRPAFPLSDIEVLAFFAAIHDPVPDLALIHYNIASCGRFLTGHDYQRVREVAPTLVGSKPTGGDVASLIDVVQLMPGLAHFVVDHQIVPGALFGAKRLHSFLANLVPDLIVELWSDCVAGDWESAARRRARFQACLHEWRGVSRHRTAPPYWRKSPLAPASTRACR